MTTLELILALGTPIAAAVGSFIGMRVTVARLREDVKTLFAKMDHLRDDQHAAQVEQEKEHGEVKAALATLEARIDGLDSPWKRKHQ